MKGNGATPYRQGAKPLAPAVLYDGRGFEVAKIDSFESVFTGLGTSRDKVRSSLPRQQPLLDVETLEGLYHDNDIAARIVETIPQEALRQGFRIVVPPDEDAESGTDEEGGDIGQLMGDALDVIETVDRYIEGWTWGRLYGGGAILIGADDGVEQEGLKEPLNEAKLQRISYLTTLDRRSLTPGSYYTDPTHPRFGRPSTYRLYPQGYAIASTALMGIEVHETRMILWDGVRASRRRRTQNDSWDFPVLQRVFPVLQQFTVAWQAVAHLMVDASQGVMKIKNLIGMIAGQQKDELQTRMELVDISRSVARAIMLDADKEDFERKATPMTGLPDVMDRLVYRLAGAARMPATVLMGMSPGGLNATGESDMRWWYDSIKAEQENRLRPRLERLIHLLFVAKEGPTRGIEPDSWEIVFPPLWQSTRGEQAEERLKVAQTDLIYFDMGALTPEEIASNRFGADGWSPETMVDLELRKQIIAIEAKAALARTKEPPRPAPVPAPVPPPAPAGPPPQEDPEEIEDALVDAHTHAFEVPGPGGRTVHVVSSTASGPGHVHHVTFGEAEGGQPVTTTPADDGAGHTHTIDLAGRSFTSGPARTEDLPRPS